MEPIASCANVPVGLQLFSIHRACRANDGKDLPALLAQVAEMGYQGVEFAGFHGWDAADLRRILDDNSLTCCGAHVGMETLLGDELEKSVATHRTLGNRYLIVPILPSQYREDLDGWKRAADALNEIAERLAPHDMFTGFHNHPGDFTPIDGQVPMDLMIARTDPRVIVQVDVGNTLAGGGDPAALIQQLPGRCRTIHLKEHGGDKNAVLGEGEANWASLLPLAATTGKAEWFIVEHERDPERALADVEKCLQNVRAIVGK